MRPKNTSRACNDDREETSSDSSEVKLLEEILKGLKKQFRIAMKSDSGRAPFQVSMFANSIAKVTKELTRLRASGRGRAATEMKISIESGLSSTEQAALQAKLSALSPASSEPPPEDARPGEAAPTASPGSLH